MIEDWEIGWSKGFGFVEMSSDNEVEVVIDGFNGIEYEGCFLNVNEVCLRELCGGGGGYGGGGCY